MLFKGTLEGKFVYITGGTGGIGTPFVRMLKEAGATVTAHDSKMEGDLVAGLNKICAQLQANTPDILINMAGYNVFNYCEEQNLKAIIDLNLMVPIRLSQAVLINMKRRNAGHIVTIGSMTALIPLPHLTGYVTAKAGLKGFSDSLRRELSGTHITVTHIVPRAVRTKMNTGTRAEINERTGVRYDEPEEVAKKIFKAIIQQQREVRLGWPERFFAFLNATFPCLIDCGLQKNRKIGEEILEADKARTKEKIQKEDSLKEY